MIKKVKSFLEQVKPYATPEGIKTLEDNVLNFLVNGQEELMDFVREKLMAMVDTVEGVEEKMKNSTSFLQHFAPIPGHLRVDRNVARQFLRGEIAFIPRYPNIYEREAGVNGTGAWTVEEVMIQTRVARAKARAANSNSSTDLPPVGEWEKIISLVMSIKGVLPQAIDAMKFAQKEVGMLSEWMGKMFANLEQKGPEIFNAIASNYTLVWAVYYCIMVPILLLNLFYAFYAGGYFRGPAPVEDEEEQFEWTVQGVCRTCGTCCAN